MNISGPRSISAINAPFQQKLDLHPFQRVTAHVVTVTGTTALLTIDGHPVVAQLTSADQATALLSRQTAHFVVTKRTHQTITLRMAENDQSPTGLTGSIPHRPELALRLLERRDIPMTANNLIIARAVLKKHRPVTSALLRDLLETLSGHGSWGGKEAELAVALKAAGLPLNAQSLALASRQAAQIGDSLSRLIAKLTDMTGQELPEELLKQLDLNLQTLHNTILSMDRESSQLAEQLESAVDMLGKSLESVLLEGSQNPAESLGEKSLLSLAQLQRRLEQAGKKELADAIAGFLKDLQWNQFLNVKTHRCSAQNDWAEVGFAIQRLRQNEGQDFSSARLRVAHESRTGSSKINPAFTRLILQVELKPGETAEVDLSIADKQIKALVTAPDAFWCRQAEEELPALEVALQGLGFTLKDSEIRVDKPPPFHRPIASDTSGVMTVDIEA